MALNLTLDQDGTEIIISRADGLLSVTVTYLHTDKRAARWDKTFKVADASDVAAIYAALEDCVLGPASTAIASKLGL